MKRNPKSIKCESILERIGNAPNRRFGLIHPGEMLLHEYMKPLRISRKRIATDIDALEIIQVIDEKRPLTADLALRLGKYFGVSAECWMNMQQDYELRMAAAVSRLDRVKPFSKKQ